MHWHGNSKSSRPQGEVLEELVASVRNVEMRFRDGTDDYSRMKRRRMRFHPEFLHHQLRKDGMKRNDPLRYVIIFSLIREEFPWLFELALDAYRTARSSSRQKAHAAKQALIDAFRDTRRGPMREMFMDDKNSHFIMHEIEFLLEQEFNVDPEIEFEDLDADTKEKK